MSTEMEEIVRNEGTFIISNNISYLVIFRLHEDRRHMSRLRLKLFSNL